jgi:hypothetical protein
MLRCFFESPVQNQNKFIFSIVGHDIAYGGLSGTSGETAYKI